MAWLSFGISQRNGAILSPPEPSLTPATVSSVVTPLLASTDFEWSFLATHLMSP